MEKKQTAVEWFYTKLITGKFTGKDTIEFLYETAKAMHKEQIEEAYNKGSDDEYSYQCVSIDIVRDEIEGKNYYKKTYGGTQC